MRLNIYFMYNNIKYNKYNICNITNMYIYNVIIKYNNLNEIIYFRR